MAVGLIGSVAYAQQPSELTQYMFHQMIYNPAYAGSSGGIAVNGLYRQQYIGFTDDQGNKVAPLSFFITGDAPIKKLHGGIGGSVISDKIGFFNNILVNLGYAYRTDLGPGEFSAGAAVELENIKIDYSKFENHIIDPGDPLTQQTGSQSDLMFDFSLGAYYEVPDKYYIGLSAAQILQSTGKTTYYQLRRTYFLDGGYTYAFANHPEWEIKPSALFQYDNVFQWNLSALLAYNKKFWGGLGYRFQDAVMIYAGVNIKGLRVGVSYDINTSMLTHYDSGSVEVSVGYVFKVEAEKFRKRYKNTRFL